MSLHREGGTQGLEIVPKVRLHYNQRSDGSLVNSMSGDLPSTVGNVLQAVSKEGAPSVHHGGGVVHRQMQSLELGLQSL